MISILNKYSNGTNIYVEWKNGEIALEGEIDTIFETDNCREVDDALYKEYYACLFKVGRVIKNKSTSNYFEGKLVELSMENEPTLIVLKDEKNTVLWKKTN